MHLISSTSINLVQRFIFKLRTELSYNIEIRLLFLKNTNSEGYIHIYAYLFLLQSLVYSQDMKKSKCPNTDESIKSCIIEGLEIVQQVGHSL